MTTHKTIGRQIGRHRRVRCTIINRINTRTTIKVIRANAATNHVITQPTNNHIVIGITNQNIIKTRAGNVFNAAKTITNRITRTAQICCQINRHTRHRTGITRRVTARAANQLIATRTTFKHVIAQPTFKLILGIVTGNVIGKISANHIFNRAKCIAASLAGTACTSR